MGTLSKLCSTGAGAIGRPWGSAVRGAPTARPSRRRLWPALAAGKPKDRRRGGCDMPTRDPGLRCSNHVLSRCPIAAAGFPGPDVSRRGRM